MLDRGGRVVGCNLEEEGMADAEPDPCIFGTDEGIAIGRLGGGIGEVLRISCRLGRRCGGTGPALLGPACMTAAWGWVLFSR